MGTRKESKNATELMQIALAKIQRRKIERIYNVNISSSPYSNSNGSALGMWYLIINQITLHDDDPIRKLYLEQETPSEKQWRYSLLKIEQELQSKFALQDTKIQPRIEQDKFDCIRAETQEATACSSGTSAERKPNR